LTLQRAREESIDAASATLVVLVQYILWGRLFSMNLLITAHEIRVNPYLNNHQKIRRQTAPKYLERSQILILEAKSKI
jgi:hypothetical protein